MIPTAKTHTHTQKDNVNRLISIEEIEPIVSNHPKQKASCPDGFTREFYQTIKKLY